MIEQNKNKIETKKKLKLIKKLDLFVELENINILIIVSINLL